MIKVSVVVPIYNVEKYLPRCLESLTNQTLKEIEIICCDDCSTDNSGLILDRVAIKNPNVIAIHNSTNLKTAKTRNIGLERARGEYVAFIDGDDYVDKDYFEKLYNAAQKNDADIAKGLTKTIYPDKRGIEISNDNKDIEEHGKFEFMGYLLSGIYRLELLKEHSIRFVIDFFCFQTQVVYYANKIVCCNDIYYNYVRHDDSCDSNIFTVEKWVALNISHANFIYDWILTHEYTPAIKDLYLKRVKNLYFYGFNKLLKQDVLEAVEILANVMIEKYNPFAISDKVKLKRKLFIKNKKTSIFDYIKLRIKGLI